MSTPAVTEDMALVIAKRELRKRIKQILSGVEAESARKQTSSCVRSLLGMPEYQNARVLSVFLSMPSGEISTEDIVKHAFQQGKKLFVPYTYKLPPREFWPSSVMDMVELASLEDFRSLKADRWGIPSPSKESIEQRRNCFGCMGKSDGETETHTLEDVLDLVIMPGLAFDSNLDRLGHGKGYYDFFLQRYLWHTQKVHKKMPFLVGLALNEQLLAPPEYVPNDATDYKLDALVLGSGEILRADDTNRISSETKEQAS